MIFFHKYAFGVKVLETASLSGFLTLDARGGGGCGRASGGRKRWRCHFIDDVANEEEEEYDGDFGGGGGRRAKRRSAAEFFDDIAAVGSDDEEEIEDGNDG